MPERIVLIGDDATGLNAALEYKNATPETEVMVLYPELNPLPEFICAAMDRYLTRGLLFPERLRALSVDGKAKRVLARDIVSGAESTITYDKLIFASGAASEDLNIPGEHLGGISRLSGHEDARRLRPIAGKTVIVGNGTNMLLAVAALMSDGDGSVEVVLTAESRKDKPVSKELEAMVLHHLEDSGIVIHREQKLERITANDTGLRLHTETGHIDADRLINATTSSPVTEMAITAGIETDGNGAITVDSTLKTSVTDIFACGACASFVTPVCRSPIPGIAIRSTEPRQGRTLAAALEGRDGEFRAPVSAYSIQLGNLTIAGAGLTIDAARECGFTPMSATAIQFDRAHFMPEANLMTLELVFDAPTRRVIGIQGLSKSGDALCGRISAVSAILSRKPSIDDIANLEIAYSPPFASAMDVLNTVANIADNMLAGVNEGIGAEEFQRLWAEREHGDHFFIDCRELGNAQQFVDRFPLHWNHIPQGEIARRTAEIPKDRKIILLCNTGARSYEAQVTLKHAGFEDVANVDGGMSALKQSGVKL